MFAIPVIVSSDEKVSPLKAVKQSAGVVKQVWGESVTGSLSMGIVFFLFILVEITAFMGAMFLVIQSLAEGSAGSRVAFNAAGITFDIVMLWITIAAMTALNGILTAALYHYAKTGEAPEQFDKELLRQAFTPKKARKLFV